MFRNSFWFSVLKVSYWVSNFGVQFDFKLIQIEIRSFEMTNIAFKKQQKAFKEFVIT